MNADRNLVASVHRMLRSHIAGPPISAARAPVPDVVHLPARRPLPPVAFGGVLTNRRSSYRFSAPDLSELGDLLGHACGPQRTITLPDGSTHIAMTAPSAGGLLSLDVYVVDLTGDTLLAGVYRYDRSEHRLDPVAPRPERRQFGRLLSQPQFAETSSTFIALAARLDTTLVKYPARHYRTLHVDSGVLVSMIYLVATALGLRCCAVTGFFDDAMDTFLGLDDDTFTTVVMPFGLPPAPSPGT